MKKFAFALVLMIMAAVVSTAFAAEVVTMENYGKFGGVPNGDTGIGFAPLTRDGLFQKATIIFDGTVEGGLTLDKDTEIKAGKYFSAYNLPMGDDVGSDVILTESNADLYGGVKKDTAEDPGLWVFDPVTGVDLTLTATSKIVAVVWDGGSKVSEEGKYVEMKLSKGKSYSVYFERRDGQKADVVVATVSKYEDLSEDFVKFISDKKVYEDGAIAVAVTAIKKFAVANAVVRVDYDGGSTRDGYTVAAGETVTLNFLPASAPTTEIASEADLSKVATISDMEKDDYPEDQTDPQVLEDLKRRVGVKVADDSSYMETYWGKFIATDNFAPSSDVYVFAKYETTAKATIVAKAFEKGETGYYARLSDLSAEANTQNNLLWMRVLAPKSVTKYWVEKDGSSARSGKALHSEQDKVKEFTLDCDGIISEKDGKLVKEGGFLIHTARWTQEVFGGGSRGGDKPASGSGGGGGGCDASGLGFAPLALVALFALRRRAR